MKRITVFLLVSLLLLGLSSSVNATLIDRGNGLIYCDSLDITWLANADMGGSMNWFQAISWADQLEYGGYEAWRLPNVSEMNSLFYNELGGTIDTPIVLSPDPDLDLFFGIAPIDYNHYIDFYWSPDNNPNDGNLAITFGFNNTHMSGEWAYNHKGLLYGHAWGVIDGDVGAPVPEPATILLFGLGLLSLAGVSRKNKTKNFAM